MTIDAVRERRKTVTRRRVDSWIALHPGDRLTIIERGMGLAKGEKQVVLAEVEIVDVRVEPVHLIDETDLAAEGITDMTPAEFGPWWAASHGYRPATQDEFLSIQCRRIEWRYLDQAP